MPSIRVGSPNMTASPCEVSPAIGLAVLGSI
ncbi:Uncharacterised protein [Vibrio cholerae]|nr:Uncharacterised protein [Vibrio cholerae]CSI66869.1 Uncharacterised protein [Vibrio cholerae]